MQIIIVGELVLFFRSISAGELRALYEERKASLFLIKMLMANKGEYVLYQIKYTKIIRGVQKCDYRVVGFNDNLEILVAAGRILKNVYQERFVLKPVEFLNESEKYVLIEHPTKFEL
jgi:hypothetical protein